MFCGDDLRLFVLLVTGPAVHGLQLAGLRNLAALTANKG